MWIVDILFLLVSAFETEFFICGLAPLADQLVTLFFVKENSDQMVTIFFLLTYKKVSKLLGIFCASLHLSIMTLDCKFNSQDGSAYFKL